MYVLGNILQKFFFYNYEIIKQFFSFICYFVLNGHFFMSGAYLCY